MEVSQKDFIAAYDKYADALYRFLFFRVYSEEKAEDLVQETFLRIWNQISEGKKIDNLRAFMYKVATNLIIDEKRKWRETFSFDDLRLSEAFLNDKRFVEVLPEEKIVFQEVMKSLESLREEEAELIKLRFVDDLSPKEIAELRDTSANTVSVQINRILEKLKTKFKDVRE